MEEHKVRKLIDIVELSLYNAEDEGHISSQSQVFNLGLKSSNVTYSLENKLIDEFINFYTFYNGFEIIWYSNIEEVGGRLHFLEIEHILQDWKGILYFDEDIQQNDLLQYFHPFDLPTDESQCGLLTKPGFTGAVYYHRAGYPELHYLDLDFNGYVEMAAEARGFFYWQLVLLDIQNGETGEITKRFKENMPIIFKNDNPHEEYLNFTWEKFVKKYESFSKNHRIILTTYLIQ